MGFSYNLVETWPKCRNSHSQALNKCDLFIFDTEELNGYTSADYSENICLKFIPELCDQETNL